MKCSQSESHCLEKSSSARQREEWTVIHGMKCLYVWQGSLVSPFPCPNNKTFCRKWNTQPGSWWRLNHKSSLRYSHGGTRCVTESWSWGRVCLVSCYRGCLIGFSEKTSVKYHYGLKAWPTAVCYWSHMKPTFFQKEKCNMKNHYRTPSTWLVCHLRIRVLNVFSPKNKSW